MSTQIRFRLSGEEEQTFLQAARQSGLSPDAYARLRALTPIDPTAALPKDLEARLAALDAKLSDPPAGSPSNDGPTALIKGMEVTDFILEIRREVRAGVSAVLSLLDGEPLPDIPHRRVQPDKSH